MADDIRRDTTLWVSPFAMATRGCTQWANQPSKNKLKNIPNFMKNDPCYGLPPCFAIEKMSVDRDKVLANLGGRKKIIKKSYISCGQNYKW